MPVEADSVWEVLREYFFEILGNPPRSLPKHLESQPCEAFRAQVDAGAADGVATRWDTWQDWNNTRMVLWRWQVSVGPGASVAEGVKAWGKYRNQWFHCVVLEVREDDSVLVRWESVEADAA